MVEEACKSFSSINFYLLALVGELPEPMDFLGLWDSPHAIPAFILGSLGSGGAAFIWLAGCPVGTRPAVR